MGLQLPQNKLSSVEFNAFLMQGHGGDVVDHYH